VVPHPHNLSPQPSTPRGLANLTLDEQQLLRYRVVAVSAWSKTLAPVEVFEAFQEKWCSLAIPTTNCCTILSIKSVSNTSCSSLSQVMIGMMPNRKNILERLQVENL